MKQRNPWNWRETPAEPAELVEPIEVIGVDPGVDLGTSAASVEAGAGNDTVEAGAGNDTVEAGAGNDTVEAGAGNDE